MQAESHTKSMDTMETAEKRIEIIFAAKLRRRDMMAEAASVQDMLRSKTKNWSGTKEIRKWRDSRCSS